MLMDERARVRARVFFRFFSLCSELFQKKKIISLSFPDLLLLLLPPLPPPTSPPQPLSTPLSAEACAAALPTYVAGVISLRLSLAS